MNHTLTIYLIKSIKDVYVGFGGKSSYSRHKHLLSKGIHTKKLQRCFDKEQKFEWQVLYELPLNEVHYNLLSRLEKALINTMFTVAPTNTLNTRNYNFTYKDLSSSEQLLFRSLVNKIITVL